MSVSGMDTQSVLSVVFSHETKGRSYPLSRRVVSVDDREVYGRCMFIRSQGNLCLVYHIVLCSLVHSVVFFSLSRGVMFI